MIVHRTDYVASGDEPTYHSHQSDYHTHVTGKSQNDVDYFSGSDVTSDHNESRTDLESGAESDMEDSASDIIHVD